MHALVASLLFFFLLQKPRTSLLAAPFLCSLWCYFVQSARLFTWLASRACVHIWHCRSQLCGFGKQSSRIERRRDPTLSDGPLLDWLGRAPAVHRAMDRRIHVVLHAAVSTSNKSLGKVLPRVRAGSSARLCIPIL